VLCATPKWTPQGGNGISDYEIRTKSYLCGTRKQADVPLRAPLPIQAGTRVISQNRGMAGQSGNRNELFCRAMARAGLSIDAMAAAVDTTPKTVKSWRRGTVPRRPAFRAAVVDLLGVDADDLWPGGEELDQPFSSRTLPTRS